MTPMSGPRRIAMLTVQIFDTVPELAAAAAADVAAELNRAIEARGEANAMFATGNSQLAMLDQLMSGPAIDWSRVRLFHMDEYVGLPDSHPASFARYIRERIVDRAQPRPKEVHYVPNQASGCDDYAALLRAHPLDLCVMGIGENGHLAFNDPPVADFEDLMDVKVVTLDDACRRQQVGEGHFPSVESVPAQALTVTIPALLRARAVIVVCPDERKAPAVTAALTGPITTECPASILQHTPHARLYLDAASAAGLPL